MSAHFILIYSLADFLSTICISSLIYKHPLWHSFIITVTTSISVFLPIILNTGLDFSVAASQCLIAPPVSVFQPYQLFHETLSLLCVMIVAPLPTVPPKVAQPQMFIRSTDTRPQYALAAILMTVSAYLGDRFHMRGPILIANSLIALVGLPIMGFASSNGARYFGVFLVTAGTNANIPTALAYQANNVRGQWKRALTSALFVAFGGIGGISGGTIFRPQDKPRYIPGISAAIA